MEQDAILPEVAIRRMDAGIAVAKARAVHDPGPPGQCPAHGVSGKLGSYARAPPRVAEPVPTLFVGMHHGQIADERPHWLWGGERVRHREDERDATIWTNPAAPTLRRQAGRGAAVGAANPAVRAIIATAGAQTAFELRSSAMPTPANLFAVIVFGMTGFAVFNWARKQAAWRAAGIGVALMFYPWFVERTWLLYAIGLGLCAALYLFRD